MHRRRFVRASLCAFAGSLAWAVGCSDETRETGTVVKTPPEDLKSMEASAEAYRAMEKDKRKGGAR